MVRNLALLAQWTDERLKQLELKKRLRKRDGETFLIPVLRGNRQHNASETTCKLDTIGLGFYSVRDFCYHGVDSSGSIIMKLISFYYLLVARHIVWISN
jgi:hypothetical protein